MKRYIFIILCLIICPICIYSQAKKTVEVSGIVSDDLGEPLIGVSVIVKDKPGMGVITDIDGKYKIKVDAYSFLVFSYIGHQPQEHLIKEENIQLDIILKPSQETVLDEIAITGTGAQKKISLTGALTTVKVEDLKTSGSSITNALAGNVAGVLARQTSGQPGANKSEFWIRGISTFGGGSSALVLVDGFERSIDEINIEDIADFTVLKDASATAIYGARGANGVILITTKHGKEGKLEVDIKGEYTYTTRTYTPELADGLNYAKLRNEAFRTRNMPVPFSDEDFMMLERGLDPDIYPNVNWMDLLLKDGAPSYKGSVGIRGGGSTSRYFLSAGYVNEGGMYNVDQTMKDYNTNANFERFTYRMNVDMNFTSTTLVKVGVAGSLEKSNHAGSNSDNIWHSIMGYNPILMPILYSNGYVPMVIEQKDDNYWEGYYNPWTAATQTGYSEIWENKLQTNITLEQKLNFITEGLEFRGRFGYDVDNKNYIQRRKNPEMWRAERLRDNNGNVVYQRMVKERLMQQFSEASGKRKEFLEADLVYNRTFNSKHDVNAILKYTRDNHINTSEIGEDLMAGINRRHQGLAGSFSYGYDKRYYLSFVFGYNGSENFAKGHQYGFFPAYSGAWNVAEESFFRDNESLDWLEMFKIRYSYGEVGNDELGNDQIGRDRFPYLAYFPNSYQEYITYGENKQPLRYNFGDIASPYMFNGLTYSAISSNNVTWEIAKKHNLGFDVHLFGDKFGLTIDFFNEKRDGIYWTRSFMSDMVGIQTEKAPRANVGSVKSSGFDGNFHLKHKVQNVDFTLRGNITYSKNEVRATDELYSRYPYKAESGYRIDQARGLIAEGLFKDYDDIRNSPLQTFGEVMPGDIKYKDVNGDGKIDDNDIVPIGATTRPNLIYGFGISANWNGFDVNLHFQGAGKSNFFIDGSTVYPFSNKENPQWGNILQDVVDSNRWIEGVNEDVNAKYPRLSYGGNDNNYRRSTYWLRDGTYLRLKTVDIGYTLPKAVSQKLFLRKARVFFMGQNLLTFAKFKLWDPELGSSNGQKYPLGKTFTLGLNIHI